MLSTMFTYLRTYPPLPLPPSLISLMVFVDVKHHVYLRRSVLLHYLSVDNSALNKFNEH